MGEHQRLACSCCLSLHIFWVAMVSGLGPQVSLKLTSLLPALPTARITGLMLLSLWRSQEKPAGQLLGLSFCDFLSSVPDCFLGPWTTGSHPV